MTVEEIAEQIADNSDSCYTVDWGEEYEALSLEEQAQVEMRVWDLIDHCDDCGWVFYIDNMETLEESTLLCWRCATDRQDQEEE